MQIETVPTTLQSLASIRGLTYFTNLYILHINPTLSMSYSRVPEDFMEGQSLAPHNFSDPENPQHGEYVSMQLRNDLYFSTLEAISKV